MSQQLKILTSTDIKQYRENQLEQNNICPLCKKEIQRSEAALDHCHRSGNVRAVLHRWCNSVLGRIENWSKRGPWDNVDFLENVVEYLKSEHTDIVHPSHGRKRRRKKNGKAKLKAKSKVPYRRNKRRRVLQHKKD